MGVLTCAGCHFGNNSTKQEFFLMQPNKTKTVLMYIPHMAPLARITAITASGLTSNEQFKAAAAVSAVIPTMQLKPEHITEVTTGIEKQIDELQSAGKKHEKPWA